MQAMPTRLFIKCEKINHLVIKSSRHKALMRT